ncbi:MAG: pirin family protein [Acidobacteria bacterium]|nr:pirin family protein [Acidobacteriota bacterium]
MTNYLPSNQRGKGNHSWLQSNFSFSFADYYNPQRMGFRALRVINEDFVAPGTGFGKHPHRDMEILTYVLEGAVEHQDTTGASGVLTPGELQHMTAGSGVMHSEMNPSSTETLHLLQIWLLPNQLGIKPKYEQKRFRVTDEPNRLHLLASKDGRDESFVLHSDAELLAAKLENGGEVKHTLRSGYAWLQVARGTVTANGKALAQGDGLAISNESEVTIQGDGEVLLFDLD